MPSDLIKGLLNAAENFESLTDDELKRLSAEKIRKQWEDNPEGMAAYEAMLQSEMDKSETVQADIGESETVQRPIEMSLCEIPYVILKPNQLYIFREMEGCVECKRYLNPGEGI